MKEQICKCGHTKNFHIVGTGGCVHSKGDGKERSSIVSSVDKWDCNCEKFEPQTIGCRKFIREDVSLLQGCSDYDIHCGVNYNGYIEYCPKCQAKTNHSQEQNVSEEVSHSNTLKTSQTASPDKCPQESGSLVSVAETKQNEMACNSEDISLTSNHSQYSTVKEVLSNSNAEAIGLANQEINGGSSPPTDISLSDKIKEMEKGCTMEWEYECSCEEDNLCHSCKSHLIGYLEGRLDELKITARMYPLATSADIRLCGDKLRRIKNG
jgi:hypothetical protein